MTCSLIQVHFITIELDHTTQCHSPPCSGSGRAVHRVILSRLSASLEQLLVLCQDQEEQVGEQLKEQVGEELKEQVGEELKEQVGGAGPGVTHCTGVPPAA